MKYFKSTQCKSNEILHCFNSHIMLPHLCQILQKVLLLMDLIFINFACMMFHALSPHQCKNYIEITRLNLMFIIGQDQLNVKIRNSIWQTISSMENPFIHLIRVPDAIDNCFTGKETINPNSLCLLGGR